MPPEKGKPHDANQLAKAIVDIATGETGPRADARGTGQGPCRRQPGATRWPKGWQSARRKMTPKRRAEIAKEAAKARWASDLNHREILELSLISRGGCVHLQSPLTVWKLCTLSSDIGIRLAPLMRPAEWESSVKTNAFAGVGRMPEQVRMRFSKPMARSMCMLDALSGVASTWLLEPTMVMTNGVKVTVDLNCRLRRTTS